MDILTKAEYESRKKQIIERVKKGEIFIYPTDTIYGIGCDATNDFAVKRVRRIKGNLNRPFSVMVPGREWIEENCDVGRAEAEWLQKLPGPYTIILGMNKPAIAQSVTGKDTVGVRIPAHWCREIARLARVPIITTSANLSGGLFMTSIEDLHDEIRRHADFMIDDGEVRGRPSTIVNLLEGSVTER